MRLLAPLPHPPDLFRRPPVRPLRRQVFEARRTAGRRLELDAVEHLEAAFAEEPDQGADAEREVDRAVVRPFEAMESEIWTEQSITRPVFTVPSAQGEQHAVAREHELA